MKIYHVSPSDGEPRICTAVRTCPFGAEAQHYESVEAARSGYERAMSAFEELSPRAWQSQWFESLTHSELSALSYYSRPTHHRAFNERIRRGQISAEDEAMIADLDSAIAKAPMGPPLRVLRGLVLSPERVEALLKDGRLDNAGYSSATVRTRVADLFALGEGQGIVVDFTTTSRAFLDLGEGEILLPRGLDLQLELVERTNSSVLVFRSL